MSEMGIFQQLFYPAKAVKKLLNRAKRCAVQFLGAIQQSKMHTELSMQFLRIVADNVQTAAFRWPLWPECADNHVASGLDRIGYLANISHAGVWSGQKVKDSAVMPYVVSCMLQLRVGNIGYEPMDAARGRP